MFSLVDDKAKRKLLDASVKAINRKLTLQDECAKGKMMKGSVKKCPGVKHPGVFKM